MPEAPEGAPLRTVLVRGLRRWCPHCGEAPLFTGWLTVREPCPRCGVRRMEHHGDAWAFFLILDRLLFVAPLVVAVYLGLSPGRPLHLWATVAVVALAVVVTTPHRYGLAVALEYAMRRATGAVGPADGHASGRADSGSSRHGSGT